MRRRFVGSTLLGLSLATAVPSTADAQPLGTFRWQLAPFCNVVTVTVTQVAGSFSLDGFDDQCGAATRAAVVGTAFPNPNGTIGIGLSVVATPGAAPVHVDVALNLATIGGPWRDSAGRTGTFMFNPPAPAPGAPRPATGGLISTVTPGPGLTGGGTTGPVSLAVMYGGTGSAPTVARSDHTHAAPGLNNTSVGVAALAANAVGSDNTATGHRALDSVTSGGLNSGFGAEALGALTTGQRNTAIGAAALFSATAGGSNTAVGTFALSGATGNGHTAVGAGALENTVTGESNTAVGLNALRSTSGSFNVAIGREAMSSLQAGSSNVAIGNLSGVSLTSGSRNIYIANGATPAQESDTIRIGSNNSERAFIGGIRGSATSIGTPIAVVVDGDGQLGTIASTRRVKEDISDLPLTQGEVLRLRPVQFRYTQAMADGSKPIQYGLIAEEVERVLPELVAYDSDGRPASVMYHVLPTLLLAEIQRLERERAAQEKEMDLLRDQIRELRQRHQ